MATNELPIMHATSTTNTHSSTLPTLFEYPNSGDEPILYSDQERGVPANDPGILFIFMSMIVWSILVVLCHLMGCFPKATSHKRLQQKSPFFKLPAELRVMIYHLAVEDILDAMAAQYKLDKHINFARRSISGLSQPYLGALALVHTSYGLRTESLRVMTSYVEAKQHKLASADRMLLRTMSVVEDLNAFILHVIFLRFVTGRILVRPRSLSWSKCNRKEKLALVKKCYLEAPRASQLALDEEICELVDITEYEDRWEALVDVLDERDVFSKSNRLEAKANSAA